MRRARGWLVVGVALLLLTGCLSNAPPMYGRDARQFLQAQGVEAELIDRLTRHETLTAEEVAGLAGYENIAVKHLLGANLGAPPEFLAELARHPHLEVRTGVASNPRAPMEVLLSLRVPGRYDTVNLALSGNPMLPQSLLREIYENGEAGLLGLARNPNLPEDLMYAIDRRGDSLELAHLARNPRLPRDLLDKYLADNRPEIRNAAQVNAQLDPRYRRPHDEMLGGP
jgi:hypothetical protein